jgi:anti-sigma B factor antagonist
MAAAALVGERKGRVSDDLTCPFRAVTVDLGGAVQVTLHGELDIAGVAELWSSVAPILEDPRRQGPLSLILDLTRLEFLDAAGLGVVVRLANKIRRRGGEVLVRPPARTLVRRVLELSDVSTRRPQGSAAARVLPPCGSMPARPRTTLPHRR